MKKQLTVDDIMEWVTCREWPREKVQEKFGKRKTVTPLQLAGAEGVEAQDKLWILLSPEIIPEKKLQLLACDFAEDVLPIYEKAYPGDKRSRQVIEAKRKWVRGEISDEQLAEARDATWNVTWTTEDTAWAIGNITWDIVWATGRATGTAAKNAAWTAAWTVVRNAAWADEKVVEKAAWNKYLKMTIKVLERR